MKINNQHTMRVTLTVKGCDRQRAEREVIYRLNEWLLSDVGQSTKNEGFPEGSLLHYVIDTEDR